MQLSRKIMILAAVFLLLSPFFTHSWDLNTLTESLYLLDHNENIYRFYADQSQDLQGSTNLPIFVEGYTYGITEALIFYPFYKFYAEVFNDPLPISVDGQILHLLSVNFSPTFMIYNLIIKLPLLIFFLATFYLVEKQRSSNLVNFLLYPMFITAVLGMVEIILGASILIFALTFVRKNYFISGIALGLAAFKIYPLLVLPYVIIVLLKKKEFKGLYILLLGLFLASMPSILYAVQDIDAFYSSTIGLQSNRLAGGITPLNILWAVPNFHFNYFVSSIYTAVFIVSYLFMIYYTSSRSIRFDQGILLIMLVFLLFSKVVNEQFLLSIFPLMLLVDRKFSSDLAAIVLLFSLIRINPVYFSAPLLHAVLPDYTGFIQSYYSIVMNMQVELFIRISLFAISLVFWFRILDFVLSHHKRFFDSEEVLEQGKVGSASTGIIDPKADVNTTPQ